MSLPQKYLTITALACTVLVSFLWGKSVGQSDVIPALENETGFSSTDFAPASLSSATSPALPTSSLTFEEVIGRQSVKHWVGQIMECDDPIYRIRNLLRLIEALHEPEDVSLALSVVGREVWKGRYETEYRMLLSKLCEIDPKLAMADRSAPSRVWGEAFICSWARRDPSACFEWARGKDLFWSGSYSARNSTLAVAIRQIACVDLDRALVLAAEEKWEPDVYVPHVEVGPHIAAQEPTFPVTPSVYFSTEDALVGKLFDLLIDERGLAEARATITRMLPSQWEKYQSLFSTWYDPVVTVDGQIIEFEGFINYSSPIGGFAWDVDFPDQTRSLEIARKMSGEWRDPEALGIPELPMGPVDLDGFLK